MIPETQHMVDTDLDYYQQWQLNRYGNIVTASGFELLTHDEVVDIETDKMIDKLNEEYERRLDDHLNY